MSRAWATARPENASSSTTRTPGRPAFVGAEVDAAVEQQAQEIKRRCHGPQRGRIDRVGLLVELLEQHLNASAMWAIRDKPAKPAMAAKEWTRRAQLLELFRARRLVIRLHHGSSSLRESLQGGRDPQAGISRQLGLGLRVGRSLRRGCGGRAAASPGSGLRARAALAGTPSGQRRWREDSSVPGKRASHHVHDLPGRAVVLGKAPGRTGLIGLLHQARHVGVRKHDDGHLPQFRVGAKPLHHLDAGHRGQHQIEQHASGWKLRARPSPLAPSRRSSPSSP